LSSPTNAERARSFDSLNSAFDVLVIGGGATGLGIAVDAATRGHRTALVEAGDFAQATSSRSTKLVHGGVRYLASGQIHLVREALHERAVMRRVAPHLVHALPTVVPARHTWQLPFYGIGLSIYDWLSGSSSMGPTRILGRRATQELVPDLAAEGLSGSILYHDAQFNDARFALALARTALDHGATVLNYTRCIRFLYSKAAERKVSGAVVRDEESGEEASISARVVINATGIFTDETRTLDEPARPQLLSVSRGSHIVVASRFLSGSAAIMVPKTEDGRVIFAIPWQGVVLIGTTDVAVSTSEMEPGYSGDEIEYLLKHIAPYLSVPIMRQDILSVFSGLRPLVTGKENTTSKLSREHHIDASHTGLITVAGGKWTTYRRMAEDTLNFAVRRGMLEPHPSVTGTLALHGAPAAGAPDPGVNPTEGPVLAEYGTDAAHLAGESRREPSMNDAMDMALPYTRGEVVYAVRQEMARTVDDVLSRRTRALWLDAQAALRAAPRVAEWMAQELGSDASWVHSQVQAFTAIAACHLLPSTDSGFPQGK
jgi:glycerol-3-phosphate dehydrogenase